MSTSNGFRAAFSPLRRRWLFARAFLRDPKGLGSVVPSSKFLMNRILERIDFDRARVIVEYGPGIGNLTAEILRQLRPDAKLVAIDTSEEFVRHLRANFQHSGLHVEHGSAAEVAAILRKLGLARADYVVSGIPYSTLPAGLRRDIVRATREVLAPEGELIVYQFSNAVLRDLQVEFPNVERGFEPLNILPARLFYCAK
jgi:phospholipid N-methyltransferase